MMLRVRLKIIGNEIIKNVGKYRKRTSIIKHTLETNTDWISPHYYVLVHHPSDGVASSPSTVNLHIFQSHAYARKRNM